MSSKTVHAGPRPYLGPGSFYGEVLRTRCDSGLILSEVRHAGPRRLPNHSHELAYFCLLLDGNYAEHLGRKTVSYKPLDIMFHPPALTHRDEIGIEGGRFFSIEVGDRWLEVLREYAAVPAGSFDLMGGEAVWLALRMYREFRTPGAASQLVIQGLLLELLAAVARREGAKVSREPAWLSGVVDCLHAEFAGSPSVGRLARQAGVHPCHLTRVFRQFKRQTVGEYVQGLRVRFACRRLSDPGVNLADLAVAAGFADQSHFSRVFKNLTGMTPGTYRRGLSR